MEKFSITLEIASFVILLYTVYRLRKKNGKIINENESINKDLRILNEKYIIEHNSKFRVGDKVYTSDSAFVLNKPYYIHKLYNGLTEVGCAIIRECPDEPDTVHNSSERGNGVRLMNLQLEPFPTCPCCHQNL